MKAPPVAAGMLAGGLIALGLAFLGLQRLRPPRPAASGPVGTVTVFAQTVDGPVPLLPGRTAALPRPQAFAFQVTARGSGPRLVRIDLDGPDRVQTLHEARLVAPVDGWSLDYVARFGESAPDALALVVTVEAPHDRPRSKRYPFQLVTASERFWDPPPSRSRRGGAGD